MQNYISSIKYIPTVLDKTNIVEIEVPQYTRFIVDKEHLSYIDSTLDFSQNKYKYPYLPLYLGQFDIPDVDNINLNVLRLMIRDNSQDSPVRIPEQLLPLKDFILDNINYHRQFYSINQNAFIYITVRSCNYNELFYKNSATWHIDGFQGARIQRHIIEQNAFWSNCAPTDFLIQPFFCESLNPAKHDINNFFNKNAQDKFLVKTNAKSIYFVNPYNIHRVSHEKFEGKRVFVRLNFSPVLIEDSTNTINPYFTNFSFEDRRDVRDFLRDYPIDEKIDSGFNF